MISKIDHVGIAVLDLDQAITTYTQLGLPFLGRETVAEQGVEVAFFQIGESKFELLAPLGEDTPIGKFIAKNGGKGGVQQVAMTVDDIDHEMARLKEAGFTLLQDQAVEGAHNTRVAFLHPKSTEGVLLELCEHRD